MWGSDCCCFVLVEGAVKVILGALKFCCDASKRAESLRSKQRASLCMLASSLTSAAISLEIHHRQHNKHAHHER